MLVGAHFGGPEKASCSYPFRLACAAEAYTSTFLLSPDVSHCILLFEARMFFPRPLLTCTSVGGAEDGVGANALSNFSSWFLLFVRGHVKGLRHEILLCVLLLGEK